MLPRPQLSQTDGAPHCQFGWSAFDCKKEAYKCDWTWPPLPVMRAMAFLHPVLGSGGVSHRRDRHSADPPSPSLLTHLLKGEGAAAE